MIMRVLFCVLIRCISGERGTIGWPFILISRVVAYKLRVSIIKILRQSPIYLSLHQTEVDESATHSIKKEPTVPPTP
jgi:hypothetical protein